MKYASLVVSVVGACLLVGRAAAEPKLPVVTASYDGSVGSAETEEELLEETSYRHQLAVRVREEWSRDLVSTLVGELTRRLAVDGSAWSYSALQVAPQLRWRAVDRLVWSTGLLARRTLFDEPDSSDLPRHYTRLKADTTLSLGLVDGLTLAPRLQGTVELYDNPTKSRQSYGLGVVLDGRLGQWSFGASYRGSLRLPLGALSLATARLDHAFGADLSWDPNRTVKREEW